MPQPLTSYGLNPIQLDKIAALAAQCNQFEALDMKLNWERLKNRSTNEVNDFLFYADGTLVGYLALYAFNNREVEISAMTAPAYRRQGIFKQLIALASTEVARLGIPNLLFICERVSPAVKPCMAAIAAQYHFSEYKMVLRQAAAPVSLPEHIQLRDATTEDDYTMAVMNHLCFDIPLEQPKPQDETRPIHPHRGTLIITWRGQVIGKIHVILGDDETYIAGFCMLPEHRGKGYGGAILSQVVAQLVAENRPNIVLEVSTDNEHALALYQRHGFETTTVFDYYRLPV